ncbi:MAG: hypothetical protein INQ03_09145 [Candidatus Heimdallarchaeota archaeon]|nr:hypothetical protein [Candidatus Heimdallarchaeota archaeon]
MKQEYFESEGEEYLINPTLEEFIKEAVAGSFATIQKTKNYLSKADIKDPNQLLSMSLADIECIDGISYQKARLLYKHAMRLRHKGNVVMNWSELEEQQKYRYLPTGSKSLDAMLIYTGGEVGWRTQSVVELRGLQGMGKTQICKTVACLAMRSKQQGGWGQGVLWLDGDNSFDFQHFKQMTEYWNVSELMLHYSRMYCIDDLILILNKITYLIQTQNIGVIIIDNLIDLFRKSYPYNGDKFRKSYPYSGDKLSNLPSLRELIKQLMYRFKEISEIHDLLIIYTNLKSRIMDTRYHTTYDDLPDHDRFITQPTIRIELDRATRKESSSYVPNSDFPFGRAKVRDCSFLGLNTGFFLITHMGIGDPEQYNNLLTHYTLYKQGNGVDILGRSVAWKFPNGKLQENQGLVYGSNRNRSRPIENTQSIKSENDTK